MSANNQPILEPVPPPLTKPKESTRVTITRMLIHGLVQILSILVVAAAWLHFGALSSTEALVALGALSGFGLAQMGRGKEPTSLVFALYEASRFIGHKYL